MREIKKIKLLNPVAIRITLPAMITIVLFVTVIFFIILPALEESFLERKHEMIRELTESAWSVLATYERRERAGLISREQAQALSIAQIRDLRYGPERKDYFWINDMHPRMIMHPYRPDLESKDVSNIEDSMGKYLFVEFVHMVREKGAGYVDYMWQWKDDPTKIVPKLSYVKGFEPWGWIIGSGIYIKDVRAELAEIREKLTTISAIILFIVSLLAFYIIRQTVLADRDRKRIWEERENFMKALQESERRLSTLMGNLPGIAYRCLNDENWTMEFCSQGCFELTGYEPFDLIGNRKLSYKELIHPDDQLFVQDQVEEMLVKREPFKLEYRIRTAAGKEKWVWEQGVGVFSDGDNLLALEGFITDITKRKLAENGLKESLKETVHSLASTTEKKDPYTAGHQQRVDRLACAIARELGLSEKRIEGLHVAAILHDIGKISVPSEFLAKPSKLTKPEKEVIKCHAEVGCDILKSIPFPWPVAEIVRQHHELLDGSGYPHGLKGKEILLEAKILTMADVVEAMSSHRPYRPSLGLKKALEEIQSGRGIRYDSQIVDACVRLIAEKKFDLSGKSVSEKTC